MIPEYTTVVGVDARHLERLALTLPTWRLHKPSLWHHPMIVFCEGVSEKDVRLLVDHPHLTVTGWPPEGVTYAGAGTCKWDNPQRHKMLAGYLHVPAALVSTPWWLKLDCDAIAKGVDDWIDPEWFAGGDAFVGPKWSFVKPGDQVLVLDRWVDDHRDQSAMRPWSDRPPLNLAPPPGSERLGVKRAVSWCAFFDTRFTEDCALAAHNTCGPYQMPVASQDGYLWYMAVRGGFGVKRINVKSRGWAVRNSWKGLRELVRESLGA